MVKLTIEMQSAIPKILSCQINEKLKKHKLDLINAECLYNCGGYVHLDLAVSLMML